MQLHRPLLATLFLVTVFFAGCKNEPVYDPAAYLSVQEQQDFVYSISRYVCKPHKRSTYATRFDTIYDDHYKKLAAAEKLVFYYPHPKTGQVFFMTARIAPSLQEKYVGLAGKYETGQTDPLHNYTEVFRTWKMPQEDLQERGHQLFDKMVKGEDLSPYYTANIQSTDWIEFPDEETWYNAEQRKWESSREDPITPLKEDILRSLGTNRDSLPVESLD